MIYQEWNYMPNQGKLPDQNKLWGSFNTDIDIEMSVKIGLTIIKKQG